MSEERTKTSVSVEVRAPSKDEVDAMARAVLDVVLCNERESVRLEALRALAAAFARPGVVVST